MNDFHYDNPDWPEEPHGPGRGRGRGRHRRRPGAEFGGPFGLPGGPFGGPGPFGPGGPFGPDGAVGPRGRGRSRRGQVRTAVLALLAEQPRNGYQLMQAVAERTDGAWRPSPGAVYPALAQLEDEGLIQSFDNEGQKAFRLTEAGQQAAASIEAKPWEVVNQAVAEWGPDQLKGLWQAYAGLAGPLRELSRNGSAADIETATKMLEQSRRRIYGLLAAEQDPTEGEELR